jgi:molybdenum cofactor cytidylyltransferase
MISAVILAAGESKRMGRPKMLLAWGAESVLEHVICVMKSAGVDDIEVVTGAVRRDVEAACSKLDARIVFNAAYSRGEMLGTLQAGLRALPFTTEAALVTLGDQPQIEASTVEALLRQYRASGARLIVPSYQRRRGHPWLLDLALWKEVLELKAPATPREFLNRHAAEICYVEIDSPSILQDLDTPEDYRKARP